MVSDGHAGKMNLRKRPNQLVHDPSPSPTVSDGSTSSYNPSSHVPVDTHRKKGARAANTSSPKKQRVASSASIGTPARLSRENVARSNAVLSSSTTRESLIRVGDAIELQFVPDCNPQVIIPITPEQGMPMAVDHEDEKLYILAVHDDGSTLHCLDFKRKMWDDTVHDIKSKHQFCSEDHRQPLPSCIWTKLTFFKDPRTNKKFLFLIGGYIGDPLNRDKWTAFNHGQFMTVLMVDISDKSWQVLNTTGAAPARFRHAVACIGNDIYVFGGRSKFPERDHEGEDNWRCSPEEILHTYSVLSFDPDTSQWTWRVPEQSLPERVKKLGFHIEALVMESPGFGKNKIFLSPGMMGEKELCYLDFSKFCLFTPSTGAAMTWDGGPQPTEAPSGEIGFHEVIPFTSARYNGGQSDSVIFAVLGENSDTYDFYHYKPPYNDEFRHLGDIDNTFTKRRIKDGTVKTGLSKSFVGCVAVGGKTYILAKGCEDVLDTIAEVSFMV